MLSSLSSGVDGSGVRTACDLPSRLPIDPYLRSGDGRNLTKPNEVLSRSRQKGLDK